MRSLIYIYVLIAAFAACDDKVGFLIVDDAGYDPAEMTIRHASDLDEIEDSTRMRLQYPWVSPAVQGVLGTLPYQFYLKVVNTTDGDVESFLKYTELRVGDGALEIPYGHEIRKGTYVISINICNEGYSLCRDSIFSVVVK